jgi:polar amino acid transport system permease protein
MRTFGLSELIFVVLALRWTLLLAMVAFVGGGLAGLAVALMRTAPWAPLRWIASLYVQLFQGTPLLMQLFMAYYGIIVLFDITIEAWPAVAMAFTLYASAFLGEIWRGAIQAIPRQQWEAADCLALSHLAKLRYAILPQAVRIAIPPTVGFLVQLIKATSVASIIGFVELTRAGQLMTNVTFQPMVIYPVVALLYFCVCWPLSMLSQHLERRIDADRGLAKRL